MMNKFIQKIKPFVLDKNNKISASRLLWFFRKNPKEKQQLFELTPNCIGEENFMERIFWIENDLVDYLNCANPICDEKLKGVTRWSVTKEEIVWNTTNHRLSCSNECKHELHSFRNDEVNPKRIQTWIKKYGITNAAELETNIFRNENPMCNPGTIKKIKETCMQKYGVDNVSKVKEVIDKIKQKADRPTSEQLSINQKREETCFKKYGVSFSLLNDNVKEKSKKTCLMKYGVEHPSQNPEIFAKMTNHGYSAKDYVFPSGKVGRIRGVEWKALDELLEKYDENDLIVETKKIPKIKYLWEDGTEHHYYPDIYIPKDNLIIEVKSTYFMEKDFDKNQRKAAATKEAGYDFKFMIY